ncbi:hypothetical protein DPMN_006160 [Dreissena polymorpha]|uniref:G-protein coupled receptors family 1 profile domain-containing protein n=1 Tax=Dreissena polymorpha TaxID=45954 RepID=A0A9D4RUL9_DREPO|nr:hypothetical protein DPMN_006160 [Dreissena polymorpha]
MLIFSWLFYPFVFLLPLFNAWGTFVYEPQKLICYPFNGFNCRGFCLFVYVIAITSTVPTIFFCYTSIIYTYVKTQKKANFGRHTSMQRSANFNTIKSDSERKRAMHELRMAFKIFAVIVVFLICRLPFMILYLVDPSMSKVDPFLHTVLIYIGSCSNWINPLIYSLSNNAILNTLKKMFSTWKKKFVGIASSNVSPK